MRELKRGGEREGGGGVWGEKDRKERGRWRDRQIGRKRERGSEREIDRQTKKERERETDRQTDRQ